MSANDDDIVTEMEEEATVLPEMQTKGIKEMEATQDYSQGHDGGFREEWRRPPTSKSMVWSMVRRFDQPQKYKPFVRSCTVIDDPEIASLREVNVKSGLPATTSTERLELLDDEENIFGIKIIGGDHRLKNYSLIVTVHIEIIEGIAGTMVIESFVVDVPQGNTKDETCYFVEAVIRYSFKESSVEE